MTQSTIQDFVLKKKDYLMTQVGNPEGEDKPNKKVCSRQLRNDRLEANAHCSTTILVFGSAKAKRRSLLVSRKLVQTWATLVCYLDRCVIYIRPSNPWPPDRL